MSNDSIFEPDDAPGPPASPRGGALGRGWGRDEYPTSEVARITGISMDTLRRWRKDGVLVPSKTVKRGALTIYLYTGFDLYRIGTVINFASTQQGKPLPRPDKRKRTKR